MELRILQSSGALDGMPEAGCSKIRVLTYVKVRGSNEIRTYKNYKMNHSDNENIALVQAALILCC